MRVIAQAIERQTDEPRLYNVNIPTVATQTSASTEVRIVSMDTDRHGADYIKRTDPKGRAYYWISNEPPLQPMEHETDVSALAKGHVTITPLDYNLTSETGLLEMADWKLGLSE